ncbi:fucolectin-like isoform 1-T1 [Discoglossus pictus]
MQFQFIITFVWILICATIPNNVIEGSTAILEDCAKPCKYENVALQGRATQSAAYRNDQLGYLANALNAIDGNQNSNYYHGSCAIVNNDVGPWWRVDLIKSYKIGYVSITNRGDCCGESLNEAEILIGESLANNGNNNPRCAQITSIPLGATQTFQCNDMVGRYVSISLPGKKAYLQFCEVQVFGVPAIHQLT